MEQFKYLKTIDSSDDASLSSFNAENVSLSGSNTGPILAGKLAENRIKEIFQPHDRALRNSMKAYDHHALVNEFYQLLKSMNESTDLFVACGGMPRFVIELFFDVEDFVKNSLSSEECMRNQKISEVRALKKIMQMLKKSNQNLRQVIEKNGQQPCISESEASEGDHYDEGKMDEEDLSACSSDSNSLVLSESQCSEEEENVNCDVFIDSQAEDFEQHPCLRMDLVKSVALCRSVVGLLLRQKEISVDFKGVDLCRDGRLAVIIMCTKDGDAFLFDIATMGEHAFGKGRLRELFESKSVLKIFFDGRPANDALHHLYYSGMENVFDLQVQRYFKLGDQSDQKLKDFTFCLLNSNNLPEQEKKKYFDLHLKSLKVSSLTKGWEARPLPKIMLECALLDIKYMFLMKDEYDHGVSYWNEQIISVSQERIDRTIAKDCAAIGQHMLKRDFSISVKEVFFEEVESFKSLFDIQNVQSMFGM